MKSAIAILLLAGLHCSAQNVDSRPKHQEHVQNASPHQADVEKRGDDAMGFSHDQSTHHFRLYSDGGAIEVIASDSKDSQNVQSIRSHLTHIVSMFSEGNFSIPMFIHDQVPPGAGVMKEKHARISYRLEELSGGGRVRIKTLDPQALKAVHEFLRFQIADHHTGDVPEISASQESGNSGEAGLR